MKKRRLSIDYLPLPELKRWPRNPKSHDLEEIGRSVARFGYINPMIVNEATGELLVGHGRLDTLTQRKHDGEPPPPGVHDQDGTWLVPVVRGITLPTEEAAAYAVADNRLTEIGGWDMPALTELLKGMDLDGVGYDAEDLEKLLHAIPPMLTYEEDTTLGDTAQDAVGYDNGSVWLRTGEAETRVFQYLLELPAFPRPSGLKTRYSRSPAQEMEHIVRTYMKPGDHFIEACAGWFTFSATAAMWGHPGVGIDLWDKSVAFGKKQLARLPKDVGRVEAIKGDCLALSYPDDHFDFGYCNPPFFQLEGYSGASQDLGNEKNLDGWLRQSSLLLKELSRVVKPGALVVTVMADYRKEGLLVPLAMKWLESGLSVGLELHDMVIQHLSSPGFKLWRHAHKLRRTVKAHEYVIVFRKPGGYLQGGEGSEVEEDSSG